MFKLNIERGEFSKTDERKLRELLASPDIEDRLNAAEQKNIAKRTALKQQLDTLNERHDPAIEVAAAKCGDTYKKIESLRAELRRAEEAHRDATAAVSHLESLKSREEFDARRELYESRDVRIDHFIIPLGSARSVVNHCTKTWIVHDGHNWYGKPVNRVVSNEDEVQCALKLLADKRKELEGMALLPLTRAEISERLMAITCEVAPTLKKFDLCIPTLDEAGEVKVENPMARPYDVLEANGVAVEGDLSIKERSIVQSQRRRKELDAVVSPTASIGDLSVRNRVRR